MVMFKFILAWVCVLLGGASLVIFFLKRAPKRFAVLHDINRFLRKRHIGLGKALVVLGALHGILSSMSLFSLNWGTLAWVVSILLGVNFYIRTRNVGPGWIWLHRLLSLVFAITLMVHLVEVDVLRIPDASDAAEAVPAPTELSSSLDATYVPGTYQVVVDAFRPGMVVEVTMSEELIESVRIVSHNEIRESIYGPALRQIPESILENQSVDVDNVSGATYTSDAIKEAVSLVLQQARVE